MVRQEMADVLLFPMPGKDKKTGCSAWWFQGRTTWTGWWTRSAAFWQQAANGKNKKPLVSYGSLV